MSYVIVTQPTVEPVSNDQLIAYLRLDDTYESELLTTMEKAARKSIEAFQNRQLITAEYEWSMDYWPCDSTFELPVGPLQSIEAITYYDVSGVQQTWASSNYQVDTTGLLGRVSLAHGVSYPTLENSKTNAITIEFTAGYGDAATDVPENTRLAIMALVAHWHEYRIPVTSTSVNEIPMHIQWMLTPESVPLAY